MANESTWMHWYEEATVNVHEELVCQRTHMVSSIGYWHGNDPLNYSLPLLLIQMVVIFVVTRITYCLIKPLHQIMIVAQIIAGVLLGPTFLPRNNEFGARLFPAGSKLVLRTMGDFGLLLHLFVLGIQIDMGSFKSMKRRWMVVGALGYVLSILFGLLTLKILELNLGSDSFTKTGIGYLVMVNSWTSFVVVSSVLKGLNILNSELGRSAASCAMVCDAIGVLLWGILGNITSSLSQSTTSVLVLLSITGFYFVLLGIARPLVVWMVKSTPAGQPMSESHFFGIISLLLIVSFYGEFVGQTSAFSAFLLGLCLPDGPPLATHMERKLDLFASGFLLPVFCASVGLRTDLRSLTETRDGGKLAIVIIMGYVGKISGVVLPSMYFGIPLLEALLLALLMCCRGVLDLSIANNWKDTMLLTEQLFAIFIAHMLIITGISTAVVHHFYDPSRRYLTCGFRRSILNSKQNTELRILVCIHTESNVSPVINLLDATNPTKGSPVSVCALQLVELTGRASSIFVPNIGPAKNTSELSCSEHIVNAFIHYERRSQGHAVVQHFTAVAPYSSIHDDICILALDKAINMVIIPFHKHWGVDGKVESSLPSIRGVNQNVLNKSPCSVGVLVDRSSIVGRQSVVACQSLYKIAVLFLGGVDDWEALAYGKRMAGHPNISVTVVCLKPWSKKSYGDNGDNEVVKRLRGDPILSEKLIYEEVMVTDGGETTQAIRGMEDNFDLFIVGKYHDPASPVISGLTAWNECPELGVIGDLLAASDFPFSVLVVQQQPMEISDF